MSEVDTSTGGISENFEIELRRIEFERNALAKADMRDAKIMRDEIRAWRASDMRHRCLMTSMLTIELLMVAAIAWRVISP